MSNDPIGEPVPTSSSQPDATAPSQSTFRLGRVIGLLAMPIVLVIVIVVGVPSGWEDALKQWFRPRLVAVTGQVEMGGKPVSGGFVRTKFLDGARGTALGPLGEDGRFELNTEDASGAFVGRHKVMVYLMDNSFPPKSLIPEKYTQPETTPLTIEVTSTPERNHFVIKLDSPE
jgi:hypothetical protein